MFGVSQAELQCHHASKLPGVTDAWFSAYSLMMTDDQASLSRPPV